MDKDKLKKILKLLSGDLSYNRVSEAKQIVKEMIENDESHKNGKANKIYPYTFTTSNSNSGGSIWTINYNF